MKVGRINAYRCKGFPQHVYHIGICLGFLKALCPLPNETPLHVVCFHKGRGGKQICVCAAGKKAKDGVGIAERGQLLHSIKIESQPSLPVMHCNPDKTCHHIQDETNNPSLRALDRTVIADSVSSRKSLLGAGGKLAHKGRGELQLGLAFAGGGVRGSVGLISFQ